MNPAGLDKLEIRRSFSASAEHYDGFADLQRQIGLELLRRFPVDSRGGPVLDLGSGTGFLSRQLAESIGSSQLLAMDIALPMLRVARRNQMDSATDFCCGDAEHLPLRNGCIERIYSNLALQWLLDARLAFAGLKRVLRSEGKLIFTTFGPDTLSELKAAWKAVDAAVHVNRFFSAEEIRGHLLEAGFTSVEIGGGLYRRSYPSVRALMKELKGIGAHNVNLDRKRKPTTKAELQRMIAHYPAQMPVGEVLATYQVLFVKAEI